MEKVKQNFLVKYLSEVREEMKKVTWPTKKQVVNNTIIVILISFGLAAFFGALDFIFNYLLELLLSQ